MKFSCIIPAYNEWPHIKNIVHLALGCPELDEIIVIDDGSTDNTWEELADITSPKLRKIQSPQNEGKMNAFFRGLQEARGTHIVMLDADYIWFRSEYLSQIIVPVLEERVDSTMIMWNNSLFICKLLKHDTFSWTRVLPRSVFDNVSYYRDGTGFWLETKINEILYQKKISVLSFYFPGVYNPPKWWKQLYWKQPKDILSSMPLWKIVRQAWYIYRQQP